MGMDPITATTLTGYLHPNKTEQAEERFLISYCNDAISLIWMLFVCYAEIRLRKKCLLAMYYNGK